MYVLKKERTFYSLRATEFKVELAMFVYFTLMEKQHVFESVHDKQMQKKLL